MTPALHSWLKENELEQYYDLLVENEFTTLASLRQLEETDLDSLDIRKVGARRKFINGIKMLRGQQPLESSTPSHVGATSVVTPTPVVTSSTPTVRTRRSIPSSSGPPASAISPAAGKDDAMWANRIVSSGSVTDEKPNLDHIGAGETWCPQPAPPRPPTQLAQAEAMNDDTYFEDFVKSQSLPFWAKPLSPGGKPPLPPSTAERRASESQQHPDEGATKKVLDATHMREELKAQEKKLKEALQNQATSTSSAATPPFSTTSAPPPSDQQQPRRRSSVSSAHMAVCAFQGAVHNTETAVDLMESQNKVMEGLVDEFSILLEEKQADELKFAQEEAKLSLKEWQRSRENTKTIMMINAPHRNEVFPYKGFSITHSSPILEAMPILLRSEAPPRLARRKSKEIHALVSQSMELLKPAACGVPAATVAAPHHKRRLQTHTK